MAAWCEKKADEPKKKRAFQQQQRMYEAAEADKVRQAAAAEADKARQAEAAERTAARAHEVVLAKLRVEEARLLSIARSGGPTNSSP